MNRILGAICILALPTAATAQDATARFVSSEGEEGGSATLTQTNDGMLIEIEVSELPANTWVALHVHETCSCDHSTDHESAGDHFTPTGADHGYIPPNGPHAGDMPTQCVDDSGTLRGQVFNTYVTLNDAENGIRGRALMIHASADDCATQPAGDAGNRLACAVFE